jgi:hypothetical protein
MLILDKTFRIICMHYLFTLCKLLKKIINLIIFKKDLYKCNRDIRLVALTRKCHVQMPRLGSKKIRRIESLKVSSLVDYYK